MIFHEVFPRTETEVSHIIIFRKFLIDSQLELPPNYDDEKGLMLRFLEGNQYKGKETYDNIMLHYKYMQSTYPLNPSVVDKYIQALNKGVIYCYKRDKSFRPIFICTIKKLPELGTDIDFILGLSTFFLHFVMTRCLIPG